ncbi:bacteriophage N4 adsorption protein A [Paraburkholderia madseniana]|uniref:Bacteriophage N4 adsorption protein A n=1 Tax=Paraburkholderia madseniana TaxID=2599607 RepID=A0AAP5BNB1_9BURK|nr:bacteriophage N4 adsorption protein A [Paraburkholderia sp. WS6]MCX4151210.1 bacteriophage N4 adsorption protein A [Paraburkholderia madseniana]MDN7154142.1 bacteriophage N4 adsorption protein A [Paraburkholderia sp. WS6]MDQ6413024.1 bacteriophage N4 adsorption protein A [Paraburkholderia madseniana]
MVVGALCLSSAAVYAQSAAVAPQPAAPQAAPSEQNALPLSGAAYRVAQEAYAAYGRGDYTGAIARAREAIRQRPDVVSLRVLLANALAALRRYNEASRSLGDAIAQIGRDPALVSRRKQIDALNVSTRAVARAGRQQPGDPDALTGAALKAAQQAYKAYAAKDFSGTVRYANEAIALRPDLLRLRLLLIDAASAAGQDTDAWNADFDASKRFGDNDELRVRRSFIGSRLAPKSSGASFAARKKGDYVEAAALAREAVAYAPDLVGYRIQLIDALFAANDLPGVQAATSAAIAADDTEIMPLTLRGYTLAAQGKTAQAEADFAKALQANDATQRNQRVARVIIADVWIAEGQPQRALDLLAPLKTNRDDTDPPIALRRYQARQLLAHALAGPNASNATTAANAANAANAVAAPMPSFDPARRPIIDCVVDQFGASCDVYAADPGFTAARATATAAAANDKTGAVGYAREAVKAAPDDPQHRVELINALSTVGDDSAATREAQKMIDAGMLDAMPDMTAAYIAQRAGNNKVAYQRFSMADKAGTMPASAAADAGYAAVQAHRNREAAQYFERAIDASAKPTDDTPPATPAQLNEMRSAHAEATRNWGFDASLNYRGAGMQPGYASSPTPGTSNNWQAGVEAYWRPFGSLGDRMFELYARGYESFGVKNGGASGIDTLQATVGARAKPFSQIDAIVAFERIIPIGSQVNPDWLARLAYSGGYGTERRVDVPSWWTAQVYAETGTYLNAGSVYATTNLELGRTFRMDRYSPKWTVFPYAVIGADYDSSVNHSIPLGAGVGVSTRYWFRDGKYDAPRSYVDLSVQYRLKITGDERARGVFFGAIYSY